MGINDDTIDEIIHTAREGSLFKNKGGYSNLTRY